MKCVRSPFVRSGALSAVLALALLLSQPVSAQGFEDNFPGPNLNASWTEQIPVDGPTVTVQNGLKISVPTGGFDYWAGVGNAPFLTLPAPAGDFTISAKLEGIKNPDGDPVEAQNYHAVIAVNFEGTDAFMWGAYRSNRFLQLERSGVGSLGNVSIPNPPVWLRIQRTGNEYRFFYKLQDADPWSPLASASGSPVVQTVTTAPTVLGIMLKTWGDGAEATATFSKFMLETGSLAGTVSGKVTTNGPAASRVAVQATNTVDGTTSLAPVAANGSYTLSLLPGQYDLRVVGSALASVGPETMKSGVNVVFGQTATADFTVQLVPDLDPATAPSFTDDFAGTTLKPQWLQSIPVAGPTIGVNNELRFTTPAGVFDYWVGVANAPRVSLPAPAGDFIASTQIVSANDPDGNPLEGADYHSTLFVNLGGTDSIMWGAYRSNGALQLERSGTGGIGSATIAGLPAWIRIRKTGNDYHFDYKQNEADAWTELTRPDGTPVIITATQTPQSVGLQHKTWGGGPASAAAFDNFSLQAVALRGYGTISGKVTTNGPSAAKVSVQAKDALGTVVASTAPAADGSYSLVVGEGTYTVSAAGPAIDPSQPAPSQSGVAVTAGGTATANLNVTMIPDLNPSTDQVFTDDFAGTSLKPEWLTVIPVAGPTVAVNNGLSFTLPANAFDAWSGIQNAPSVRLPAPQADFDASARLASVNNPAGEPVEGLSYHSVIFVDFGLTDVLYWGTYRSNTFLQLERSGVGSLGNIPIDSLPVSLRVTRTVDGPTSSYRFYFRQSDTDAWTQLTDANDQPVVVNVATPPIAVGLMQKTWEAVPLTATWSSFRLEAAQLRLYGTLSGRITKAGANLSSYKVQVMGPEGNLVATLPVAAEGTFSTQIIPGTYTLRVIDATPAVAATKAAVVVPSGQSATADFNLDGGTGPVRGDANGNGRLEVTDVIAVLRHVVGLAPLTGDALVAADVNGNGVNVTDAIAILRAVAGLAPLP